MALKRFGVSVPDDLLTKFDQIVEKLGYVGRSEAIRDAMRMYISDKEWEFEQEGKAATFTVVYTHKPKLMAEMIRAQHAAEAEVLSSTHIHLSHAHCLEVMALKGTRKQIEDLANRISGITGVSFSRLFTFTMPESEELDHHH